MNEMTTAGDIGSSTYSSSSTAPMVRYGDKKVNKRMDVLKKQAEHKTNQFKKQEKRKMKTFREIVKDGKEITESPVGKVGRTKEEEALAHIENTNLAVKFRKIVRELGGKNVARQLLAGMDPVGRRVEESNESVESFIRDMGYKIKEEKAGVKQKEIIFYKLEDANDALEDLIEAGFEEKYNFDINEKRKSISYTI